MTSANRSIYKPLDEYLAAIGAPKNVVLSATAHCESLYVNTITGKLHSADTNMAETILVSKLPGYCGYGKGAIVMKDGKPIRAHYACDGEPQLAEGETLWPCLFSYSDKQPRLFDRE